MCGRLNIISDPICHWVNEVLNINFTTNNNADLSPGQEIAAITQSVKSAQSQTLNRHNNSQTLPLLQQQNFNWGIKPNWAKRLLINAQSETVTVKPTFKTVIQNQRCLIPCSGWYEWSTENNKKVKYLFSAKNEEPLLMAGIFYLTPSPQLVTLTTKANQTFQAYHHRMPLIIAPTDINYWFNSSTTTLQPLLQSEIAPALNVTKVS